MILMPLAASSMTPGEDWLKSFSYDQREAFLSCYHEAGHTVAARYFKCPVAWVSIDPDFLRSNPLAIENDCADGSPVTMAIASTLLNPILERGQIATEDEAEIVRAYCIQVFAGPLAESNKSERPPEGAERDIWQIHSVLKHLFGHKWIRKSRFNQYFDEAHAFVIDNRKVISHFAFKLHNKKTIVGSDIDDLIDWAISRTEQQPLNPKTLCQDRVGIAPLSRNNSLI